MRTELGRCGEYRLAWQRTSIDRFLRSSLPEAANFALITSLDSSLDVVAIADALGLGHLRGRPVGAGYLVPVDALVGKSHGPGGIFFGFDEVWFFPGPDITPKPDGLSIVAPLSLEAATLSPYMDWLLANACLLGLGDGEGLNLCYHETIVWRSL